MTHTTMTRRVHISYSVEQDETGTWCASAELPGGGANGEGAMLIGHIPTVRQLPRKLHRSILPAARQPGHGTSKHAGKDGAPREGHPRWE